MITPEKLERQQRGREAMRQAIAAYTGPITNVRRGSKSTNVLPRWWGEQKKTPPGSSENTPRQRTSSPIATSSGFVILFQPSPQVLAHPAEFDLIGKFGFPIPSTAIIALPVTESW